MMVPLRWIFRSRWAAIAWSLGICLTAARVAGGHGHGHETGTVDASASRDGLATVATALDAEEGL